MRRIKFLSNQLTLNIYCFARVTLPSVKGEKKRTAWYEEQQQQRPKEEKKPGFTLTPPFPGIAAAGRTEASRPKSRWRERSSNPDVRFPRKKKVSSGGVSRKKSGITGGRKRVLSTADGRALMSSSALFTPFVLAEHAGGRIVDKDCPSSPPLGKRSPYPHFFPVRCAKLEHVTGERGGRGSTPNGLPLPGW